MTLYMKNIINKIESIFFSKYNYKMSMMTEPITIIIETPVAMEPEVPICAPPLKLFKESKMPDIVFKKNEKFSTNDIVILLDSSGSMDSLGEEPVQACKSFIQTQYDIAMAEQDPNIKLKLLNVKIQLITFSDTYKVVIDAPVSDLDQTTINYRPDGMTDLYSPLYNIFNKNNNTPKDIVIISDGQNNTGPYKAEYVKRQIINAIDAGWTLKFVGCTVDSITESEKLGLQQYTSDCSYDFEGESAPTMTVLMRAHSNEVSSMNRIRTGE